MQDTNLTHKDYVQMAIDAGVAPLELRFFPILGCESGFPVAYRTQTVIHSVLLGDMQESYYTRVSDVRPCGLELLKHELQHLVPAIQQFAKAERNVAYFSVRCPSEFVESADLYQAVSDVLSKNPTLKPEKICLEFPASLMEKDSERARASILDMKVLKVRTALVGCATENFPLAKLLTVPTDSVILDPAATMWAGDRNKPQLLDSLVAYIRSMGIEVVAEGTPEQRKLMRRSDCFGFFESGTEGLSFEEALAQKEEDEAS